MARVPATVTVVQRPLAGVPTRNRPVLSWQIPWRSPMRAGAVITGTPLDPLVAFAELGRMKLGEGDLRAVLGRVAELARQTLPGGVGASVTLVESDRAFTAAFAGQLALDLDETQYQEGFGPCLEVAQSAGTGPRPPAGRPLPGKPSPPGCAPPCRWRCRSRKPSSARSTSTPPGPPCSTGRPPSWPGPSPDTPPSPSPTPASTRPPRRWPRTCGERWKPAPSSSRPRASSSPSSTAPPSRLSRSSPGSPRPPTASHATAPPTWSPAPPKTGPADSLPSSGAKLAQLCAKFDLLLCQTCAIFVPWT